MSDYRVCVGFFKFQVRGLSQTCSNYLFEAVIGVWGGCPSKSHVSKDVPEKPYMRASGNDPMLG